ncbi:MAG: UbiD family decarboxylase [Chloroflexi bacterium]|nr:MAG: UbiD family decarboxylase [Chloroflexota bacterium]MBL1196444.1 UbiD family decarboxylase [Chloroflexota bacterium]NOH13739.1 UbiD family decarboxylase [Chloroflexota bacterium]
MSQSFREYLDDLRAQGPEELWEIDQSVPLEYEMTAYAMELERQQYPPALLFNSVDGFDNPVVCNLFSSKKRLADILGIPERELITGWPQVAAHRIKPEQVTDAPVKDVVHKGADVDLSKFPFPVHFASDGGRYITSGVAIANDPDTGVGNLNFTRLQIKGKSVMGASMHSRGDLWDFQRRAEARGEALEVAIAIGVHPAVSIAGATQLPINEDELELAGGILNEPLAVVPAETIDLMIPANAELVIEGVIKAETREDEGPFSEYTGYATDRSTRHVFNVTAVSHRNGMIYHDIVPGSASDHLNLSKVSRVPRVYEALKRIIPNATAISYPFSGTHFHCYLALRDPKPGQAKQAMMLLFGLDMYLKLVVVVDDDIDVNNEQEVLWALATRFQADRDSFVVDDVLCNMLDPSSRDGMSAKMGLDATRPTDFTAKKMLLPDDVIEKVRAGIATRTSK